MQLFGSETSSAIVIHFSLALSAIVILCCGHILLAGFSVLLIHNACANRSTNYTFSRATLLAHMFLYLLIIYTHRSQIIYIQCILYIKQCSINRMVYRSYLASIFIKVKKNSTWLYRVSVWLTWFMNNIIINIKVANTANVLSVFRRYLLV